MKLEKTLTVENINRIMLNIDYAVRGPVLQRAEQIERELAKGVPKPFTRVVRANLGDSIALGQKPITFIRQVLALVSHPALLDSPEFSDDVKQRARELLDDCLQRCTGAYSPASGLGAVRRAVAARQARRDGVPAATFDVIIGAGVSDLIRSVLALFAHHSPGTPSAVMIPCPQYPLFSATLAELGIRQAPYFLDEDDGWRLQVEELQRSYREASLTSHVRAIVVINPGNPTGQVLSRENIEDVIKFAYEHNLFILADEFYQENIVSKPFTSFKQVYILVVPGSGFGQAEASFHFRITILHPVEEFHYMMESIRRLHFDFLKQHS